MSKLTLGRKYWPGLSEKNRERFIDLFVARVKDTYISKLSLYTDEKVAYGTPVQAQEGKIQIPTRVISEGRSIAMMYKLYKSSTGWRIYDVQIEGVSLISTYRSQFYDILNKGSFDDLLLKLEKPEEKPKNK
jgi:phospholipid transport system substrate-binding protein